MKRLIRNTLSVLLSAYVLVATIGITVSIHTCKYTGKQKVYFIDDSGCCPDSPATNCCNKEVVHSQLQLKKLSFYKLIIPDFDPDIHCGFVNVEALLPTIENTGLAIKTDRAPPPLAKDLRSSLCIYRI